MISKRSNTASAKGRSIAPGIPAQKAARSAYHAWLRGRPCACAGLNQECDGTIHADAQPGGVLPLSAACSLKRMAGTREFELRYLPKSLSDLAEHYRVQWAVSLIERCFANIKDS